MKFLVFPRLTLALGHWRRSSPSLTHPVIILTGLMVWLAFAASAWAHHSGAMFDQTQTITMDATIAKFEWGNPHVIVIVDATNEKGETERYTLECSSPNLMAHSGWKFNTLKTGERVTVAYHPLRNGANGGMLATVKLADGKVLDAW